jgi:hypothetical protein
MNRLLTTNGNYPVQGISPGREFSIAVSGTFASGVVKAQYATAAPVKATLTIDDNEDADAIILTASDAGTQGNEITLAITVPSTPSATLAITQTDRDFIITTATDAGDAAAVTIGAGENGEVEITRDDEGSQGNSWDVVVIDPGTISGALSATTSFANARPRLVITLGTDSETDPDDAKNTATLVAAAVNAIAGFAATASGTGEDAIPETAVTAFEGGGDNAANTSTVADVFAALQSQIFAPHLTVALANDADTDELIKPLTETALTGGTAGTFVDFTGDNAISFSAAGELIGTNPGILPVININLGSATGSTSIRTIVTELPE